MGAAVDVYTAREFGEWSFEFNHGYDMGFAHAITYARGHALADRPRLVGGDGAQFNPCRVFRRNRQRAWNQGYRLGWTTGIRRARLPE